MILLAKTSDQTRQRRITGRTFSIPVRGLLDRKISGKDQRNTSDLQSSSEIIKKQEKA